MSDEFVLQLLAPVDHRRERKHHRGTWRALKNEWGGHVPQISVSIVFWVAVPLAAGVVRTVRRDVG